MAAMVSPVETVAMPVALATAVTGATALSARLAQRERPEHLRARLAEPVAWVELVALVAMAVRAER
jgi:aromatic ring hydroxylase